MLRVRDAGSRSVWICACWAGVRNLRNKLKFMIAESPMLCASSLASDKGGKAYLALHIGIIFYRLHFIADRSGKNRWN